MEDCLMSARSQYQTHYARSLSDRDSFWSAEADQIEWQTPFTQV
ncbi:MAG: hypothetical protein EAZ24_05530, partial [Burkholderiales bacterium]